MPGKRQLRHRVEDAQSRSMRRVPRWQDKDGLGEIEFAGDRLHRVVIKPVGVQDDRERVAGKAPGGEHIERHKAQAHQGLPAAIAASFKAAVSTPSASPSSAIERRPKPSLNTRAFSPNHSPFATRAPFAAAASWKRATAAPSKAGFRRRTEQIAPASGRTHST